MDLNEHLKRARAKRDPAKLKTILDAGRKKANEKKKGGNDVDQKS